MALQIQVSGLMPSGYGAACALNSLQDSGSSVASSDSSVFGGRLLKKISAIRLSTGLHLSSSPALQCFSVWWSDAATELKPDWKTAHNMRVKTLQKLDCREGNSTTSSSTELPESYWALLLKDRSKGLFTTEAFTRDMILTRTAVLSFLAAITTDVESASDIFEEIIVGRTAMLGFLAAVGNELETGRSVLQQLTLRGEFSMLVVGVAVLLLSLYQESKRQENGSISPGPFTLKAERLNGQLAMLGFALLMVTEYAKGSAVL